MRFADVEIEGEFWRERLETVLTRTIPSQHAQLAAHGILDSLKLPDPPPPLRFPRNEHDFTVQVFWDSDVGKWIEAASYALSHRRDADIEAKIEAITDDLAAPRPRRLPQLLVSRPRARQALDQPPRQPRALQPRPPARRRRRLLPRDRPPPLLESSSATSPMSAPTFGPPRPEAWLCGHQEIELALIKLCRRPATAATRPRSLFHRRARAPAALLRRRGGRPRRGSQGLLGEELRVQPVA